MRIRRSLLAFLLASAVASLLVHGLDARQDSQPSSSSSSAADLGQWTRAASWPIDVEHAALLDDATVLVWGSGNAAVWNPATGDFVAAPFVRANAEGAGQASLAGVPTLFGGSVPGSTSSGVTDVSRFDRATASWTPAASMTMPRWRPGAVALADGRVLVTGGANGCPTCYVTTPEVFDPATGSWTPLPSAEPASSTYPFLFVVPGGRVLHAGSADLSAAAHSLEIASGAWSLVDPAIVDGGNAVMFTPGRVMMSGSASAPGMSGAATANTFVLDLTSAAPRWRLGAPMTRARALHNLTVLPDGDVLATAGMSTRDGSDPLQSVLAAELWTPATGAWRGVAPMPTAKPSRSLSLLLADGRVLVAGASADGSTGTSVDIYSPPYLSRGTRPRVLAAPGALASGVPSVVRTSDPNIASVSLLGLGSVTHSFDQGQRYVPLAFEPTSGGVIVTPPADPAMAPPGNYLLFVVNRAGVPSVGRLVTIGAASSAASKLSSAAAIAPLALSAEIGAQALAAAVPAGLALDAAASSDQGTPIRNTVVTGAFSTTAGNELLLAFVSADYSSGASTTVTGISGGGLTWQLVVRTNAQRGTAEIWRAVAAAPLTAASVTATLSQPGASSLTVVSLTGADTSGTNGSGAIGAVKSASAASGAPTAALTTTRANSWVFGVGTDWDRAIARTLGPGQTMVHQYLAPVGDTYWVQRMTATTPAAGTVVTVNDTAPTTDRFNVSLAEIRPASTTGDTTPPTVSVTVPAAGATVSGTTVTVTATAADNVGVLGVQFKLDGNNLGAEATASPYSIVWNTTSATNAGHTLTAVARDAAANMTTSAPVAVTVNNTDATPPTVSMMAPAAGATVSGTAVTVTATAADNVGVVGVQFQLDGVNLLAEDTVSPYSITWNTTGASNTGHTLTAIARDAAGHHTTSSGVSVTVSNPPTISAVNVTSITGTSALVLWTTNVAANSRVDYGTTIGYGQSTVLDPTLVSLHTQTVSGLNPATPYHYRVVSTDTGGLTATSGDFVFTTADTIFPTVSLTAPAPGANLTGNVTLTAAAADNVGVVGVQFKLDGGNLGSETTAPFTLVWNTTTAANGSHMLTAVARDLAGNVTTSTPPVPVNVSNAAPVALAIDSTAFADRSTNASTIATAAFSTHAANELLLAFVSADDVAAGNTVTGVAGGGLTWQLVVRTNAQRGTAEIWRAFAPALLSNVTVTATLSQASAASITVVTFIGADATGTNGSGAIGAIKSASAGTGAPTASLVTTRANAWVFGVGTDWTNSVARTVGSNQTLVHQYLASVGDTYWVQRTNSATPSSGTTVTLNDTAPTGDRFDFSLCEVLPALNAGPPPPTFSLSGSVSAAGAGATVTLSGAASGTVIASGTGAYTFPALVAGTYTVAPTLTGVNFTPPSRTTSIVNAAVTGIDFTVAAPPPTFSLSGSVSAAGAGATVTLSGAGSGTVIANGTGAYTFPSLVAGTYTVAPTLTGVNFTPPSRTTTIVNAAVTGIDFTAAAAPPTYSISGTLSPAANGGAGATVTLSGDSSATTIANGSGAYSFNSLLPGNYTVTPSSQGATFAPLAQNVVVVGSSITGVDFTATGSSNVFFFDDFNGTALSSEWTVISRHGEYAQSESECNIPQAVSVANGFMTITTSAQVTSCGDFNVDGSVRHAPQSWPFSTGDVQWKNRSFTYGTVEVRAKVPPKAATLWPAIWLLGANCQATNPMTADINYSTCPNFSASYVEIDMVECDLNNYCQLALWQGGNFPTCGYPVDTNFHIFTLTWKPNLVSVAVDGVATGCSYTTGVPTTPMFLIIQTQTGGSGGNPNSALLPAQFVIDYVKVTQP